MFSFFVIRNSQALEKEVGDSVNIQNILNGNSNWRGRQQQIIALQDKVKSSRLDSSFFNLYIVK